MLVDVLFRLELEESCSIMSEADNWLSAAIV